jgi:hypothetical protein
MTVNELIEDLKKYDGNLRAITLNGVIIDTCEVLVEYNPPELERCVQIWEQEIK